MNVIDRIKSLNLFRVAIDYLIMVNPKRSMGGILLGMAMTVFHDILLPALWRLDWLDLAGLSWWQLMVLGFFVTHIPTIMESFSKKNEFPPEIEHLLSATRRLVYEGKLNKYQTQLVYLSAVKKVLEIMPDQVRSAIETSGNILSTDQQTAEPQLTQSTNDESDLVA